MINTIENSEKINTPMINEDIKNRILELKGLYDEVTTSDLQGIIEAISLDINKINASEIDEILLGYTYGDIDFNEAIKQIEDLIK